MDYYFVFLNACCDFDDQTTFSNVGDYPIFAKNIGLVFDSWSLDDLFSSHPEIFCTERLKFLIEKNYENFSGIEQFKAIERISTGSNWNAQFPGARPGNYWQVIINGTAMKDDFGYWSEKKHLIISRRVIEFLLRNHVSEMLGKKIDIDINDFFVEYEKKLIESK